MADNWSEIFDVVNEKDEVIGQERRDKVHKLGLLHRSVHVFVFNGAGEVLLQRRSLHKALEPGKWDLSCAEHLSAGEDYAAGAVRGLGEELGIAAADVVTGGVVGCAAAGGALADDATNGAEGANSSDGDGGGGTGGLGGGGGAGSAGRGLEVVRPAYYHEHDWPEQGMKDYEFTATFAVRYDGAITADPKEVAETEFWTLERLDSALASASARGDFAVWFVDEMAAVGSELPAMRARLSG